LGLCNGYSVLTADDCARYSGCKAAACCVLVAGLLKARHLPDGHAKCGALHESAVRSNWTAPPQGIHGCLSLPGEVLPKAEPIIFDVQKGIRIEVKTTPIEIQFQGGPRFHWFPDSKTFYYEASERGEKSIELRTVDSETGVQTIVVREKSDRYVDPGETFSRCLYDSGEVLWSSERDGWNHLYLYNGKTGALKNQVTQGP
jgi:Dipeptidyl peptidase IV (DPP IV) N-terminal region